MIEQAGQYSQRVGVTFTTKIRKLLP